MSNTSETPMLQVQAIAWVVRAHASDMSDEDILALTAWLEADPAHVEAFDAAERVLMAAEGEGAAPAAVVSIAAHRPLHKPAMPPLWWTAGGAVAAGFAAVILLVNPWLSNRSTVYETATGQTQEITLADGTTLHLNSDTRISVRLTRKARDIVLDKGELALNVVHDENRPFSVTAGEQVLRDVGTVFDVLRHDGAVTVTVKSGAVAMLSKGATPQTPDPKSVLHAGDQAVIDEASGRAERSRVMLSQAFAWERGQAVYRNRSLAYVVSDLNRYFDKPIVVDAKTGKMNVTAVLTLDSEASVVRHLQDFLPVEATETDKAILLREESD
jgi:transmembrane sensor